MSDLNIEIKLTPDGKMPSRATTGSAAFDVYAAEDSWVFKGTVSKIKLGFSMAIPSTHFAYFRPRSGLAANHGVMMASSGVIDSDYRGELVMPLISHAAVQYQVVKGDRIGQMLILPVPSVQLSQVKELPPSERGTGGFGSTGK